MSQPPKVEAHLRPPAAPGSPWLLDIDPCPACGHAHRHRLVGPLPRGGVLRAVPCGTTYMVGVHLDSPEGDGAAPTT